MFEGNGERSVVSTWNELALEAIRLGDPKPTEITRALHMAHAAMYDSWAAYDPEAVGAYFTGEAIGPDSAEARDIAVSFAAFRALSEVFPDQVYLFREYFVSLGLDPSNASTDPTSPEGIGNLAAASVIETRAADGSNSENEYADTSGYESQNSDDPDDPDFNPNAWTPLRVPTGTVRDENGIPIATDNPASYTVQKPIAPHWGSVDPFAIADSDDYLPPAPPQLGDFSEYIDATGKVTTGDAAYREQFGALVGISAGLTAEQKVIAEYWADGPQTSTPPGHWNEIAQDISVREGYGLDEDVKFFFALNNALFDAGIAIWDAKYTYDFVRPQTAIRYLFDGQEIESWGGPNQGTQIIQGEDWVPYQNVTFVTPAFPEYTSGHSGFSYAAATVIEAFTGSATLYDGRSTGAYDLDGNGVSDLIGQYTTDELGFENYDGSPITLTWGTVWDAAAEAGLSRLYGGIHIQDGDLNGRQIGADVARDVWAATSELFYMDDDNEIRPGSGALRTIHLGAGSDRVIGSMADLSGLSIYDFGSDDRIEIEGLSLSEGGLTVRSGSAILEIDQNGDGVPDGTITLEGDFDETRFIAMTVNGQTTLTVATNSDVELTDADERFITTDPAGNVVAAGAGTDVVVAEDGGDILDGDDGDDVLVGGAGQDILIGGRGSDVTTGGGGGDIFSFDVDDEAGASGFTAEFITDFQPGIDTVELSGFGDLTFETLAWNLTANGLALILPGSRAIVFEGIESEDELSASDFAFPEGKRDVVFSLLSDQRLTDANDRYVAVGPFADDVEGLDGNDALVTGEASDILDGGVGDDVLTAGAGDDELIGGPGSDTHTGGSGGDTFRFFGIDDPAGAGFVADYITDYEAGTDTIYLHGFAGIATFDDLAFATLADGLAANLGGGRFIVFEGLTDASQLDPNDFEFDGEAPELTVSLANDTGTSDADGITNNPSISGVANDDVGVAALELRLGTSGSFADVTSALTSDGSFDFSRADIESALGRSLSDEQTSFTLRVTDLEGNSVDRTVAFTLDTTEPGIASAPGGVLATAPDELVVTFSEPMSSSAFGAAGYALTDGDGATVEITSADRVSAMTVRLNLADTLGDGAYSLTVPVASDLAGNALTGGNTLAFDVDAITRIVATGPNNGSKKANLDRKIFVEFDRPIDPATVDASSFQVIALGEPLEGRITVSSNGKIITFFPDELLPSATQLRIKVDGDKITGLDGKPVDADGDGTPGGLLRTDFQTVTLTRIPDTNIEGFIFDANYRDENGLDIPLEGVVVSVVGLPGVTAVTDANGRFLLEDVPIPQVYLDFDASGVTNRPEFDYGTITKPVDTVAGQTVGLQSGDKAFNIYFAALAEGDVTEIVEGQATEAGIGENGLANLTEIFPNIDPSQWEKLKVCIPADSLSFDDGTLAQEISVMVFEPDRIPAPLPPGFDPTVVFTVKAGDASNVDGKAQIDFPNLDNLAVGEKRPILSFDHDAGEWVQTGTAIVVDDGSGGTVLRSEGDTGVNTLGWKGIGGNPTSPTAGPNLPDNPARDPEDPNAPESPEDPEDPCKDEGIDNQEWFSISRSALTALWNTAAEFFKFGDLAKCIGDAIAQGASLGESLAKAWEAWWYGKGSVFGPILDLVDNIKQSAKIAVEKIFDFTSSNLTAKASAAIEAAKGILETGEKLLAAQTDPDCPSPNTNAIRALMQSISFQISNVETWVDFGKGLLAGGKAGAVQAVFGLACNIIDKIKFFAGLSDLQSVTNSQSETSIFALSANSLEKGAISSADLFQVLASQANDPAQPPEPTDPNFDFATEDDPSFRDTLDPETAAEMGQDFLDAIQAVADYNVEIEPPEPLPSVGVVLDFAANAQNVIEVFSEELLARYGISEEALFRITSEGIEIRGALGPDRQLSLQLAASTEYVLEIFDPFTNAYGEVTFETAASGAITQVPIPVFTNLAEFQDIDGDRLADLAESVIGTRLDEPDTDGDGILDGAEVEQGLNPLDGVGFPTGLIGNAPMSGTSRDIEVTGALDGSGGQTAFLATGDYGLAIVDASVFANTILQSQLDLSGENSRVAVDATRDLAFVASTSGLHIVDVSDPVEPQLVQTAPIPGGAKSLLLRDGLLFVGGRDLYVVNPVAGAILAEIDTSGPVTDIAANDDTIYAVVNNQTLVSYAFNGQFLVEVDSVAIPTPPVRRQPFDDFRIFISDDVAYVSNGLDLTVIAPTRPLERGGYVTFDVSDPENLELISNIDTPAVQAANLQTVTNGAGLGLIAAGQRGLQIHNSSDPSDTYELIAEFDTPGDAQAVALASGIAYVADGSGGLQVINFLPFDADGQAPTVTFNSTASDADDTEPGIQVEEGETIRLDLGITDDVQIRNVELLVNGQVVLNDVSAPYELAFAVPALSPGATSVMIAVRATDTGGNSTTSDSVVFEIIPDNTPPEVLAVSPPPDRLILVGESTVTISFSEPLDDATIAAADVTIEAADGTMFAARDLTLLVDDQVALFTFDPLAIGEYTLNFNLAGVTDRAGNEIVTPPASQPISVVDATAVWNDPAGGNWFDASKWRDGLVPVEQDGVAVVVDDGSVVNISGNVDVERILLQGILQLSSGTLTTDEFEGVAGELRHTGGTIANTTLFGEPGFIVLVTSGTWSGVTLDADAGVGDTFGRALDVEDGLTVDGDLAVRLSSRVEFNGGQSVDGTGTITLETTGSWLRLVNQQSGVGEIVTLGPDLMLQGQGYTDVTDRTNDRFRILGEVEAQGGELTLNYIDNAGAALQLDSAGGGWVTLQTAIDNAAVEVAAGADVRAVSSQLNGVSVGGAGTTRIESATVSDLTVLGQAEIEATVANRTASMTVTNDLTVAGELAVSGSNARYAYLYFTGAQAVDGAGQILLSRNNAIGDETVNNWVQLNGQLFNEREVLTFGEDLDLAGTGTVTVSRSEDRIQVLGTATGQAEGLGLYYMDNDGATLTVDNSAGQVFFGTLLEDSVITAAAGSTGAVGLANSTIVSDVTFNTDVLLETAPNTNKAVTFEDAITLNGTLSIAAQSGRTNTLNINGEQTLGGTGAIDLSRANLNPGQAGFNRVDFNGDLSGTAEVLTFGAGIELKGDGVVFASQTEDSLNILGQVTGVDGQTLTLRDVNNQGGVLDIDATNGTVLLGERITDTVVTGSGSIGFESSTTLDNVTLGMDAGFGTLTTNQSVFATNGLTVDAELTFAAGQNRDAYLYMTGEQTLDGSGTVTLSDANAPVGNFDNRIIFDGVLSGSETLTIDAATTITGQGYLYAQDSGDDILLEGSFLADDGQLQVDDLQALEGTLGATADGVLDINTTQTLTERGTLQVGLAGSGTDQSAGRIDHNSGVLSLAGTLALDVAPDFTASLGDTFDIITSQGGFAGDFDAFEGFDLEGNLAFKLIQSNPNTLTLEVVTLAEATAEGFVGAPPFTPDPRPPFVKGDVILTDALPDRVSDANVIGDQTTQDNGPDTFENVTFQVDLDRQAILSDQDLLIEQGLTLDNVTFTFAGSQQAETFLDFDGAQTLGGTGTIDFIRDSGFGPSAQHLFYLSNQVTGAELLTIESGITIQGHVAILAQEAGIDRIKVLGTLKGTDGSTLTVQDIDNDGAGLTVDASAGTVLAGSALRETRFVDADGTSGVLNLQNGATLQDITLAMDTSLDASGAGSIDVDVARGLRLENSTLTLQGFNNQALLDFLGTQAVTGTGTIVLAENLTGPTDNDIRFDGFESFSETLSFGAGITLRGTGLIDARDTGDTISILGTLAGEGTGALVVNDLDNAGGTVTVDASAGAVGFGSGIANATIAAATGNTGAIDLLDNGELRDVTFGIDTRMDAELSNLDATVREGLTLAGSIFTLAGSEFATAELEFFGEQALDGIGTLLMSDENAVDGRAVNNQLTFTGTKGGQETFRIADGVMLEGSGEVTVSTGDLLDLDGEVTATGGTLSLQGIEDVAGEITATVGSRLSFDRTFGLDAGAGVTVALAGSGADLTTGFIDIAGLLQRGGTFTFDLAPDFDAEIGTEVELLRTTEGFTDTFASVAGAAIDGTKGLALIQNGNSLFARVVDIAQAGQQLTRADLPAAPLVPVLTQNLTAETVDQTFLDTLTGSFATEDYDAIVTSGTWSGVTLDADAGVGDTFGRALDVEDGLTVDGDLAVRLSSRVEFNGGQSVDGTGTITLETTGSWLRLVNQQSGVGEIVTLGPDLMLQGQGYTDVTDRTNDRFRILGEVEAQGGELTLNYIDNAGAALQLDSAGGGWVTLQTAIDNAAVEVAAGADVRAVSSQLNGVSVGGAGTTRIESATVSDLTVLGQAEIEATVANRTASMTVTNDLTVAGELAVSGSNARYAYLYFTGAQAVDGAGQILLSRNNAIGDETVNNWVQLNGQLFNEREVLTFGEDLDLAGTGTVTVSRSEDRIQVLGTATGQAEGLGLYYMDNDGATLTVDNSAGQVFFGTLLEDSVITAAAGSTGAVGLANSTIVSDVTFNTDVLLETAPNTNKAVTFEDAITLNGTLSIAAQSGRTNTLNINGEQTLGGTGAIDLSRANLNPGQAGFNRVDFNGDLSGTAEVLTFGAGIELKGDGVVFASQTEDSLNILGQVTGVDGQTLTLRDVNNQGGVLDIDATNGTVLLGERITDTVVTGSGSIGFESSTTLDNVTLGMDAGFGTLTTNQSVFATNGLTVDAELTFAAGQNRDAYLYMTGEQTLDGSGTVTLSDANAPVGNFDNRIIFDGVLSGSETLTIDAATTITGQGYLYAQDSGDDILLEGSFLADDGQLQVDDLQALEGTLGATADGVLDINTTQTLTERGTLQVGLAGSGTDQSAGRIDHNSGVLSLAGTLALDVAPDFTASLGDTFDIITSQGGFAGDFDAFEGFDLEGNLAFKLIQSNPNTLTLEVVTLAEATAEGFVGAPPFTPDPRPPFVKGDVILTDALPDRVSDANVIGDQTTQDNGPDTFENVTFQVDLDRQAILSDQDLLIEQGLTLDNVTFTFAGSQQAETFLDFDGAQTLGGTGTIDFIRDSGFGPSAQHLFYLSNQVTGAELLTIESGITIQGHVAILAQEAGIDRIKVLGTLKGTDGSTLTVQDIDNDGAGLTVDASAGTVLAGSALRETRFVDADGTSGVLNLQNGATLQDITLAMDTSLDASGAGSIDVDVARGLRLENSTLTLQGFNNQALLDFLGTQAVTGTGTIVLAENLTGPTDNDIRFDGFESFSETLSFGAGITLRGTGLIDARDTGDTISILGTLAGEGTGALVVNDLDNAGGTVTVDASAGAVGFGSGIANATIAAATGNTGAIDLLDNGELRDVTFGIDTRMDAELSNLDATVREGLTLAGSIFTLAGSEFATAELEFFGEQALDGIGTLLMSDENAVDGRAVNNQLTFTGTKGGQETFRIADGVMLEGSGEVTVSTGDLLDLDGEVTATGGTLSLQGIEDVAGEITATVGSRLSFDRTFGLDAGAGVTVALAGSGADLTTGFIDIAGLLQRGGTFTFDLAPDFDAEIGTEVELLRTTEGFTDTFASVAGAAIDGTKGLALIQNGNSLFARVVDIAQAGQQLTRADLPAAPLVPVLTQNLTAETVDQTFLDTLTGSFATEDYDAIVTSGTWSGVTLDADAGVGDTFGRALDVEDGLTVDGDLAVRLSSRVEFNGGQSVDGTGTITLETTGSWLRLVNQQSGVGEIVTLGPDLMLQGQGYTDVTDRTNDRFRILGEVEAQGGELTLNYIDNAGAALQLDSAGGGWVTLQTAIDNAAVEVAAGADVRAVSSQLNGVSVGGAGTTRIESATVSDLTVLGQAEIEATVANRTASMTVTNDLTVAGELAVSGSNARYAYLYFTGAQAVDGAGQILLSRNNAIGDETVNNWVQLNGQLFNEREVLTFGEDLDLAGTGTVTVSRSEDRIQVLGTATGQAEGLGLYYMDNDGATLTVDNSAGQVFFGTLLEDSVITAAAGSTGAVGLANSTIVSDVTFNTDVLLETAPNTNKAVTFEDAITLNGTLSIAAQSGRTNTLNINGEQTLGGTGAIDLSRANLNPGQAGFNRVDFNGDLSGTAEVLTFGAGIELKGDGVVFASQTEDSLNILGQVTGVDGQTLTLRDVNNQGGVLDIDATNGTVLLGERITDTVVTGSGSIGFESSTTLDNVTLGMDAGFGTLTTNQSVFATNGLTVDAELTFAAGQNRDAYLYMTGEQTLDGSGTVTLSDANAPVGNFDNRIIFDGVLSGSETLTIDAATTITGQGYLYAQDSGDDILLEGSFLADDGQLQVDDLQALEGTLGATADGVLDINTTQTLTERGTLQVGLAGSGTDQSAGRIDHNSGVLSLAGTLALDVAPDFTASLGDTFDIITSQGGFAGDFDAFEGFDLEGNLAFKLIQSNPNTLTLEVTTDDDATSFNQIEELNLGLL